MKKFLIKGLGWTVFAIVLAVQIVIDTILIPIWAIQCLFTRILDWEDFKEGFVGILKGISESVVEMKNIMREL